MIIELPGLTARADQLAAAWMGGGEQPALIVKLIGGTPHGRLASSGALADGA